MLLVIFRPRQFERSSVRERAIAVLTAFWSAVASLVELLQAALKSFGLITSPSFARTERGTVPVPDSVAWITDGSVPAASVSRVLLHASTLVPIASPRFVRAPAAA